MAYRRRVSRPPRTDFGHRHGIPWFSPENYARIREIVIDHEDLPLSFDDWRERAENQKSYWNRRNDLAVPVDIDPDQYVAWCGAQGFDPRRNFLKRYAEFRAYGKLY